MDREPKPAQKLTSAQRRKLRALGHHLEPVVHIGKQGISSEVIEAVDAALLTHELVKVRINRNAEGERHDTANHLASQTGAAVAQVLGATLLLFRAHPDEPKLLA